MDELPHTDFVLLTSSKSEGYEGMDELSHTDFVLPTSSKSEGYEA